MTSADVKLILENQIALMSATLALAEQRYVKHEHGDELKNCARQSRARCQEIERDERAIMQRLLG